MIAALAKLINRCIHSSSPSAHSCTFDDQVDGKRSMHVVASARERYSWGSCAGLSMARNSLSICLLHPMHTNNPWLLKPELVGTTQHFELARSIMFTKVASMSPVSQLFGWQQLQMDCREVDGDTSPPPARSWQPGIQRQTGCLS
jgi:hypothetical protein